jgi:hypothetical protein
MPIVQVSKKYFVKLSLNLAVMGMLTLVASLALQTTVSAASLRTPSTKPSAVKPNASCDATGSTGCNVTFSGTLSGALAATVGTATITPPTTLNGTAQSITFSFVTNVADTRGTTASPWALSAASPGLTVDTVNGTSIDPFVVSTVTAACTAATSCSNAAITAGAGSLTSAGGPYATAPTGGDIGTTAVTVAGNVPLDADTVGGAYTGTITVTAGPTV